MLVEDGVEVASVELFESFELDQGSVEASSGLAGSIVTRSDVSVAIASSKFAQFSFDSC